jgi:hypothetical protein
LLTHGVLYRYSADDDNEEAQLVVPKQERDNILREFHDMPTAEHYGTDHTLTKISRHFYWPGIRHDVKDYVRKCNACQRYKVDNKKPAGLLQTPVLHQRFEFLSIDLFGPLPEVPQGENWIYIIEECATRWTELFSLTQATADACAWTLVNEICLRFGLPCCVISDNGTQFISAVMQKVCYCLGITQKFTPVYHPSANMVERKNRDLKTQLAILVGTNHTDWPNKLPAIRFAMNTAKCSSTGYSAAFLNFGRELRTPAEVSHDLRSVIQNENFIPEVTPRLLKLADHLKEAQEVQEKEQDRKKTTADSKRRPGPTYAPGDRVYVVTHLVSNASKQRSSKFNPRRDGPYLILSAKGPCSYEVASLEAPNIPLGVYHTSALTPAQEEDQSTPVIPIRRRGRPRKVPPTTTTLRTSVETPKSSEGGD